ncbi:hypothetical protein JCM4914_73040 [Streptomyces platensis subsp. malvinus]
MQVTHGRRPLVPFPLCGPGFTSDGGTLITGVSTLPRRGGVRGGSTRPPSMGVAAPTPPGRAGPDPPVRREVYDAGPYRVTHPYGQRVVTMCTSHCPTRRAETAIEALTAWRDVFRLPEVRSAAQRIGANMIRT